MYAITDEALAILGAIYIALVLFPAVICFRKGKPGFGVVAILAGYLFFLAWVGAIRVAKPNSAWAQRAYPPDGDKMRLARKRFPHAKPAPAPPLPVIEAPPPPVTEAPPPADEAPPPGEPTEWLPTHLIPKGGLLAREEPNRIVPELLRMKAGEEVQVVATKGIWVQVTTADGWAAWVEGQRLVKQ